MLNDSETRSLWGQKTRFPALHLWASQNAAQALNNWKFLASGSVMLKSWWSWSKSWQKGVHVINYIIWQIFAAVWAEGPRAHLAQNLLLSFMAEMLSLDKGWAWIKKIPCHSCFTSFPWMNKGLHFQGLPRLSLSIFIFFLEGLNLEWRVWAPSGTNR